MSKPLTQAVKDERERCAEICRDVEAMYRSEAREAGRLAPNSYGHGAAWGSAETAEEIRKEILGEDD